GRCPSRGRLPCTRWAIAVPLRHAFPTRWPADGEAVERKGGEELHASIPELGMDATLDDAEERLAGVARLRRLEAADRPPMGALHGLACRLELGPGVVHHVQNHHHVRAERLLHGDAALGREELTAVVVGAAEGRAALGDLPV